MLVNDYDVAIIGAGPAGLQAALVLARTRKKLIIFDSPEAPRNGVSHGVHNFLGLDGLLPAQIRAQAWEQIVVYQSAELCVERIVDISGGDAELFLMRGENGSLIRAKQVIFAVGYRDIYPDIAGFMDCWGDSIISCPFCDGYENRDRVWGLVAYSETVLEHFAMMYKNWTSDAKIIALPPIKLSPSQHEAFRAQNLPVYESDIVEIEHQSGKVEAIRLSNGLRVEVGTLLWRLEEAPTMLTQRLIEHYKLELNANGYIKTDGLHQTGVKGLWVVGDVKGNAGALGAAFAGNQAALGIIREWYA